LFQNYFDIIVESSHNSKLPVHENMCKRKAPEYLHIKETMWFTSTAYQEVSE
uniref:Transposase n=1 Tax=Haemonchus placei TaxID=6290 RepID=A0A0N4W1K2_HAEPC